MARAREAIRLTWTILPDRPPLVHARPGGNVVGSVTFVPFTILPPTPMCHRGGKRVIIVSMGRNRRTTVTDVAREAGVSQATVSYVLNKTPGQRLTPQTIKRVEEAAARLGYVRNRAAQALARGANNFAVLDMSDFVTRESAAALAAPMVKILRRAGFEPHQVWWGPGVEGFTREESLLRLAHAAE